MSGMGHTPVGVHAYSLEKKKMLMITEKKTKKKTTFNDFQTL